MKSSELKEIAVIAIPALTVIGFVEDIYTRKGVDDWVWYFLALVLTIFLSKRPLPFVLAALFSVLTLTGYYLSPPGPDGSLALINCFTGIGVLGVTAVMIYCRQNVESAWWKS